MSAGSPQKDGYKKFVEDGSTEGSINDTPGRNKKSDKEIAPSRFATGGKKETKQELEDYRSSEDEDKQNKRGKSELTISVDSNDE